MRVANDAIGDLGIAHHYAPGAEPGMLDRAAAFVATNETAAFIVGLAVSFPVILLLAYRIARSLRSRRRARSAPSMMRAAAMAGAARPRRGGRRPSPSMWRREAD